MFLLVVFKMYFIAFDKFSWPASLCLPEGRLARYWAEQTIDRRTLDRFASILHGTVQLPRVCYQRRTKGDSDAVREALEWEMPCH